MRFITNTLQKCIMKTLSQFKKRHLNSPNKKSNKCRILRFKNSDNNLKRRIKRRCF